jgi:hypothetical protein
MPYISVGEENSGAIDLYYDDHSRPPSRLRWDEGKRRTF